MMPWGGLDRATERPAHTMGAMLKASIRRSWAYFSLLLGIPFSELTGVRHMRVRVFVGPLERILIATGRGAKPQEVPSRGRYSGVGLFFGWHGWR